MQLISNRENCSKDNQTGTSKYTGVFWNKRLNLWTSSIRFNGKNYILGNFRNEEDAAKRYQEVLEDTTRNIIPTYKKMTKEENMTGKWQVKKLSTSL